MGACRPAAHLYSHLYYKVAVRTAYGVGQFLTPLAMSPPTLQVATGMTTAVPVHAAPSTAQAVVGYLPPSHGSVCHGISGATAAIASLVAGAMGWVTDATDAAVTTQGDRAASPKLHPRFRRQTEWP